MPYSNIDKPSKYFNTKLYTGTGSSNAVTGVGFKPDWVWLKRRDSTASHALFDINRGVTKQLRTNTTGADETISWFSSFDTDGFTVSTTESDGNASGGTYTSWNWLGANTTTSNTAGTISSTVSANTTSGFSIVSYTGNGSTGTVGHGLGTTPSMYIIKRRSAVNNWIVWHKGNGGSSVMFLDLTNAPPDTNTAFTNGTTPTSSVFSVGNTAYVNASASTYIAYCFADVKGYSKFGSYEGNSSTDGTFVYLGFKPAFVIIKNITNGNNWIMLDNKRGTYNLQSTTLYPNTNDTEDSTTTNFGMDFLSNGIKMRTSGGYTTNSNNASGNTYIYMAFAENPFVSSKGIPTTAR